MEKVLSFFILSNLSNLYFFLVLLFTLLFISSSLTFAIPPLLSLLCFSSSSFSAIIFIDEIDAIATKRFDAQTGADREVQRILLELLNQMDGFDQTVNVKVIMATNRADTLDPALLRPGRLDR